ncbi:Gfo/Idh/MocA family oxidoreductase [Herbiconiux sp.]|uniref:Gfo/Idh/MocA family protein n=1 Tax=Herbiconiux sp. TaxID=1871186 RepID=UPI0025C59597|nr:Gfo/Idh/MocA family oxidoreductase [Herbiconiux sp.]
MTTPTSAPTPSGSTDPIRWGILGAGKIASAFVGDLTSAGHTVAAVGARSGDSARAFADRFGIPHAHGGYDALLADDTVDVVYIATPQGLHEEHAGMVFAAGKAALIEKSFTVDGASARRVADAARTAGVFAMEAMWTRFLPPMVELRRAIDDGSIGELRSVDTGHYQAIRPQPGSRHLDPDLGGGALIDLGVYGVSFAVQLLGAPTSIEAVGDILPSGVDGDATVLMRHERGYSSTRFSMQQAGPSRAAVIGSEGYLELDPYWFTWTSLSRHSGGRPSVELERFDAGPTPRGLHFQAAEVERCLRAGLTESPVMPLEESVVVMQTLDRIRERLHAS